MSLLSLHLSDHILFFTIGILLPAISIYSSLVSTEGLRLNENEKCRVYLGNSFILFLLAGLVIINSYFLDRSLGDIGLIKPDNTNFSLWSTFLLLFIIIYIADTIFSVYPKSRKQKTIEKWQKRAYILPSTSKEFCCFIVLSLSAGIFEEILYRGFLITYLYNLFETNESGIYLAVLIPAVVFGISHTYQGVQAVIKVIVMAILFGVVFLLSGSVLWLMVLHFLVDLNGGILSLKLFSNPENEINDIC